jgi:hypothetical protein
MHCFIAAIISLVIGILANVISDLILRIMDRDERHGKAILTGSVVGVIAFIILQGVLPSGNSQPGDRPVMNPSSSSSPTAALSPPPPAAGSPTPTTSSPSSTALQPYSLLYVAQKISVPGGSCGGATVVEFGKDNPAVVPGVQTLFNDPSKWDFSVDNCATTGDKQTLKVSGGSSFTTSVNPDSTPSSCDLQITENPVGTSLVPAAGQSALFETQNKILVLITFKEIDTSPSYVLHAVVTAWKINGG